MKKTLWIVAIVLCLPALGWGRGLRTQTVTQTAFFPGGPGWIVTVNRHQGSGAYPGARTTWTKTGSTRMNVADLKALREKHRLPKGKFSVHQSWTFSSVKLFPF
jgi:hypothetical protein